MTRIEQNIKIALEALQKECPKTSSCGDFCYCRALSEVMGYQRSIIPRKYAKLELPDFTGMVDGKRVVSEAVMRMATSSLLRYCFGDDSVLLTTPRSKLNELSVMDRRFEDGCNVFVHGQVGDDGLKNAGGLGRSFLAALILKEAIWRRIFKGNKALTYRFASVHDLITEVLDKDNRDSDWLTDWLVIDDINSYQTKALPITLDRIVSRRRMMSLPTVFVLQFDAETCDLEQALGNMAAKTYFDKDLCFHMRLG